MTGLKKSLSAFSGAALMLNIVIGAGLLSLPGLTVRSTGGHALWAWALCAAAAVPLLWTFIVMGRRFPHAGGVAHFARRAFGLGAYAAVSMIFLGAVTFGLPAIALTGGHYMAQIAPGSPFLYAVCLLVAAPAVQFLSVEAAGRIAGATALAVVVLFSALLAAGFYSVPWERAAAHITPVTEIDLALLTAPFMMIFFAFTGWEVAAGLSEEFKNPAQDFPRAMMISFTSVCVIYFAAVILAHTAADAENHEALFALIAERTFGGAGEIFVSLFAVLVVFANLTGAVWAVSRMVYALSREKLIPARLRLNKNGAPVSSVFAVTAVLLSVLISSVLGWTDLSRMLSIAGQNFLLLYGVCGAALLRAAQTWGERLPALCTLITVGGFLVVEGPALLYPAALALFGFALLRFSEKGSG